MRPLDGGAHFRAELAWTGGATAGFVVPPEVIFDLGGGAQPSIVATVNGHRFVTSIAVREGWYWLPADDRAVAGAAFGQLMDVEVELKPPVRADHARARSARASRASRPGTRARPGYPRPRRP